MLEATAWGAIAAASLLLGAFIALATTVSDRTLGLVLAFGAGVLMSAVAYELVEESLGYGSPLPAAGFAAGALTFFGGSELLARRSGARGERSQGMAIALGAVLDGIPESVVLGLSLVSGSISVPILAAVLISNVPEGIGASADMRADGKPASSILRLWLTVVVASGLASGLGYLLLQTAPAEVVASVQMFAAGAIIAMLAESMIPEAYQKGDRIVGLATAFGFAVSALLSYWT
jgi:ZIP family zinc transporter